MSNQHTTPEDDIGQHIFGVESAIDHLAELNPSRLYDDADRIMEAAMRLTRLASTLRLARKHHAA